MVFFAPAKINIGLNILRKRKDGFHEIHSVFYPIPWEDAIEMVENEAGEDRFTSSNIAIDGKPEDNLCLKAIRLMREEFDLPFFDVHLIKNIPIGAGLGGGSSDATQVLLHLNKQYELGMDTQHLAKKAAVLGSDCPFFLYQQACLVEGRGEHITPIDFSLRGKHLAVIYPDLHISTKEAYQGVVPEDRNEALFNSNGGGLLQESMNAWQNSVRNDFQNGLYHNHPVLQETHALLKEAGATYVGMSGSGSSIFGIFDQATKIQTKHTLFMCEL